MRLRLRDLPQWQQDAVIVASSVAIGVLLYLLNPSPLYNTAITAPSWLHLVVFGCLCAIEFLRRRAPLIVLGIGVALLAVDGVAGLTMPVLIVFADLLYAATLYGPRRLSGDMIPAVVLSTVVVVVAALIMAPDWRTTLLSCLAALPIIVVPVWWAANVRQHQEIVAAERRNTEQLAKIAELDRVTAVSAERAHMARDLHDVIAGHLSAIAIQSEAALSMHEDKQTSLAVLRAVRENSLSALEEMRAMIRLLRSEGGADDETTAPARLGDLSALIESARAGGMELSVSAELGDGRLPAAVDLTAYRIVQEALTNAMKHAPGATARLEVRCADGMLTVVVVNALTGGSAETGDGIGLVNMKERAAVVGGSLTAGRTGEGWRVHAVLPVAGVRA
jgi:signal transduction histidine kinase